VRVIVLAAAFLPPQGTPVLPRICGESIHLVTEKIDRRQLPDDVRRGSHRPGSFVVSTAAAQEHRGLARFKHGDPDGRLSRHDGQ
jgi:hypothetical protein